MKINDIIPQTFPAYEQPVDISKMAEVPVYVLNKLLRTYKEGLRISSWQGEKSRLVNMLSDANSSEELRLFKESLMAEIYIQQKLDEENLSF